MLYRELFNQYSKFLHLHNLWFDLSYGYQTIHPLCALLCQTPLIKKQEKEEEKKRNSTSTSTLM